MKNTDQLTEGARIAKLKKKKKQNQLAEITWNEEARAEFLTGFHKRKLQRQKKAQEKAMERLKEEKREERRMKREAIQAQVQDLPDFHGDPCDSDADDKPVVDNHEYRTWTTVTTVSTFDDGRSISQVQGEQEQDGEEHLEAEEQQEVAKDRNEGLQTPKKHMHSRVKIKRKTSQQHKRKSSKKNTGGRKTTAKKGSNTKRK